MGSNLTMSETGEIGIVLDASGQLTDEQRFAILDRERKCGLLAAAESSFKKELSMTKAALMNNPDFIKMLKMQEKIKVARELQKRERVVLDDLYDAALKDAGIENVADAFMKLLPDAPPKTGHRGRPRKQLSEGK